MRTVIIIALSVFGVTAAASAACTVIVEVKARKLGLIVVKHSKAKEGGLWFLGAAGLL